MSEFVSFYRSQAPGLRKTLGQIHGNQTQHQRAKHGGKFDQSCEQCYRLESAELHWSGVYADFLEKGK